MIDEEYFNRSWSRRIKKMALHIPSGVSVLDLGCGKMELEKYLTDNKYYPVDCYGDLNKKLIYDFNKKQFPDFKVDVCFVSGLLEYIHDPNWLVKKITLACKVCIISYYDKNKSHDLAFRKKNRWVNHLTKKEFIKLFISQGWKLEFAAAGKTPYYIFTKV